MKSEDLLSKLSPYHTGKTESLWERYVIPSPLSATVYEQGFNHLISMKGIHEIHIGESDRGLVLMFYLHHSTNGYDGFITTLSSHEIVDMVIE